MVKFSILNLFLLLAIMEVRSAIQKMKMADKDNPLPEEVVRMKKGAQQITFLLRDRSKNKWHPLSKSDPIPENIWIGGGAVKVIIHGYTYKEYQSLEEKLEEQNIWNLGIAYANHNSSINVFIVDWTVLSTEPLTRYLQAAQSTMFVGEAAAEFLVRLANESYIANWDMVHVMGLSLGGHTAGVVGKKVQDLAGVKIGRITGLDPAGPFFDIRGKMPEDIAGFLEKTDAKFVDIIHCNMRLPGKSFLGHFGSCVFAGHADFYPDGGERQLSCTPSSDRSDTPCSHMKCTEIMALSLSKQLLACPCDNWLNYKDGKCECTKESGGVFMGDPCDLSASGRYYILMEN